MLSVLDRKWREHLYEMDYLQEGIGLRAMAQRDPLVEYQREGFDMFAAMMDGIKEESVGFLFNLEVQVEEAPRRRGRRRRRGGGARSAGRSWWPRAWRPRAARSQLQYSAPTVDGDVNAGTVAGRQGRRRRLRRRAPQRDVPVRLGQEVQALPRRPAVAGQLRALQAGQAQPRARR